MVDISRDPRWGRVMEGAGEDPFLATAFALARVKGFQGDDLSAIDTMLACMKHFAAYGWTQAGRDYTHAEVSDVTLHNVILPPFRAAVREGGGDERNELVQRSQRCAGDGRHLSPTRPVERRMGF